MVGGGGEDRGGGGLLAETFLNFGSSLLKQLKIKDSKSISMKPEQWYEKSTTTKTVKLIIQNS